MLLVGQEKVTQFQLPNQLPEKAFTLNSSGSIALTFARMWSKESNSSGRVSKLFLPVHSSVANRLLVFDSKPI